MWTQQGELFSLIEKKKRELGGIPENTCPDIDFILELDWSSPTSRKDYEEAMENIRNANAKLRSLGIEWYQFCTELSEKSDGIIKDLEEEIAERDKEIEDLKDIITGQKQD